jgi:hypothetical protein
MSLAGNGKTLKEKFIERKRNCEGEVERKRGRERVKERERRRKRER